MAHTPVTFNPEQPAAHYERCRNLLLGIKNMLLLGTILPIISLIIGFICTLNTPAGMAVHAFMGILFALLAILGCVTRRGKICFSSIPLGIGASLTTLVTGGGYFAAIGFFAYLAAVFATYKVITYLNIFFEIKELPGFPLFDESMEDAPFAVMVEMNVEEYAVEETIPTEKVVHHYEPLGPPSEEMGEILTAGILDSEEKALTEYDRETAEELNDVPEDLRDEVAMSLGHLSPNFTEQENTENSPSDDEHIYETMVKIRVNKKEELSDVELFG